MNCDDIRKNFPDYWRGALAGDELQTVEAHLASCPQCRAEAEALKYVWGALGDMPEAEPGPVVRNRFYASLRDMERREMERGEGFLHWMRLPAVQISGALGILVVGLLAGMAIGNNSARDSGQVAQLRNEVSSMRQLVTLSLLQQQNASDRLRGVNWSYRVEQSDSEVLGALLTTVNHDPNVNVRLAAVDAMRNFADSPVGRHGLVQALNKQSSPLVQIAILDQLVDLRIKSAAPAIDTLKASSGVNPEVKTHADWALRQLQ